MRYNGDKGSWTPWIKETGKKIFKNQYITREIEIMTDFTERELKDKQAFHVVLTTYNSRTSQRMKKLRIFKGPPVMLSIEEEIELTRIISNIFISNNFHCLAYNICTDHVHMVIVCAYKELNSIILRIKSESSRKYRKLKFSHFLLSNQKRKHLWSQKFFRADLDIWKLATLSKQPGMLYKEDHLDHTITYISSNREKHGLLFSKELNLIIKSFLKNQDEAFAEEYG